MNKVILVEDEIFARQGLRNLIDWESCGFRICGEADNGEEALRTIAETKPDLIITDIRMPVLDGLELIRTVRAGGNQDVKFIIISGYGDFKYAQQAIKFGVKDFILKPIDEEELTDALHQLAGQIEKDRLMEDATEGYAQKALERLLQGHADEAELAAYARQLGLERNGRYGYVIVEANGGSLTSLPQSHTPSPSHSSPESPQSHTPSPSHSSPESPQSHTPSPSHSSPESPQSHTPSPSHSSPESPQSHMPSPSHSSPESPQSHMPSPSISSPGSPQSYTPSPSHSSLPPLASTQPPPSPPSLPPTSLQASRPSPREWRGEIARTVRQLGLVSHPVYLHEVRPGVWGFPVRLGPSETPDALEAAASRLVSRLQSQWALPVMGYVGELAPSLDALKDAYLTACETIQYKFAFASRNVLRYDRLADQELRYVEFEPGEYAARLEQLEGGDPESRCAAVDWIFEQIQQKRYAPEAVQNAIARFVFGVIGAIRSLQGDESELRSLEPALQWREAPLTLSGLKERFRAFIEEAADMAAQLRKNNAKGEIVKIKQFIECHYNEDINLKSIAAKFYMNPVYLGQLFRKTYGVYFNDFLLQLRIRNAKRLLRQTELRVYEIARNVGFDNADYFVCKFEKVEGKTPTAYRNELLANT